MNVRSTEKSMAFESSRLSVAPMMDWTDRHCRYFHRLLSRRALLYTEMVTAKAIIHGDRVRLLNTRPEEHPVALQLGGSEPREVAEACRIALDWGYDEINLNVGCPSDRVQSGTFGACLMRAPERVADICTAMRKAAGPGGPEITVKCRIGVDEQIPEDTLPVFLKRIQDAGVGRVIIHARKAWLQGLSPRENRTIPPLNYPLVYRMKTQFPQFHLSINGGVETLGAALGHLKAGMDGVMIGRAAYQTPALLAEVDGCIFGGKAASPDLADIVQHMAGYADAHIRAGGRLNHVTRHMVGLFNGRPGARRWRQTLSEKAHVDGMGGRLLLRALAEVDTAV